MNFFFFRGCGLFPEIYHADADGVVFLVWKKETSSKTNKVQLQVMNICLRLKLYLKTLLGC